MMVTECNKKVRTIHRFQWQDLIQEVGNHARREPLTEVSDEWLATGSRKVYLKNSITLLK